MDHDILEIVVDHREVQAGVIEVLRGMREVSVVMRQLEVGDYQVGGWIFERKTISDFGISIADGRLFRQAHGLIHSGNGVAFILEGEDQEWAKVGMSRQSMQGALVCLNLIFGIPVLRSHSPRETADLLFFTGNQLRRTSLEIVSRGGWKRPKRRRRAQLRLLQGLPGIGSHRAAALLDHFGSPRAVFTARREDLMEVRGIQDGIAGGIHWVLGEAGGREDPRSSRSNA